MSSRYPSAIDLCKDIPEEVIFRGFLFRAIEKGGLKSAIIVSAVTFGIGHIVNIVLIVVVLGGYLVYLVKVLPNKKVPE